MESSLSPGQKILPKLRYRHRRMMQGRMRLFSQPVELSTRQIVRGQEFSALIFAPVKIGRGSLVVNWRWGEGGLVLLSMGFIVITLFVSAALERAKLVTISFLVAVWLIRARNAG